MKFFDRLAIFVEQLPEALKNLSSAIRDAAKNQHSESQLANRITAEIRFPREVEDAQTAAQDKQIRTQRWIARWTALAFLAAGVYAYISFRQWQEAKTQTAQTRQQMRLDKRAWMQLAPKIKEISIENGHPIEIPVEFLDLGGTPALKVKSFVVAQKLSPSEMFSFDDLNSQFGSNATSGAIFPSKEFGGVITATVYAPDFKAQSYAPYIAGQDDVAAWNAHGFFVVVYGIVNYSDIFGVSHWTKLCHYYPSDFPFRREALANMKKCAEEGNDVDSNDLPLD